MSVFGSPHDGAPAPTVAFCSAVDDSLVLVSRTGIHVTIFVVSPDGSSTETSSFLLGGEVRDTLLEHGLHPFQTDADEWAFLTRAVASDGFARRGGSLFLPYAYTRLGSGAQGVLEFEFPLHVHADGADPNSVMRFILLEEQSERARARERRRAEEEARRREEEERRAEARERERVVNLRKRFREWKKAHPTALEGTEPAEFLELERS
jgi:hypothetical protein